MNGIFNGNMLSYNKKKNEHDNGKIIIELTITCAGTCKHSSRQYNYLFF